MKVSEITVATIVDYLREDEYDESQIKSILSAARAFVRSYTGLTDEEVDEHDDFYIAVLILCQDMYDNRAYQANKGSTSNANNIATNKTVDTILGLHCVNLI